MRAFIAIIGFVGVLWSSPASAWGQDGHAIVAELAQRRLTAEARAVIDDILGPGSSLASIASWADDWRADHRETARWHFVDIDVDSPAYDAARDCRPVEGQGDCLVAELARALNALADPSLSPIDKRPALKFVVHLMGDLTQPLHCTERSGDAGGNALFVDFDGRKEHRKAIRFHALWDETLIQERVYAWGAFVDDLEVNEMPLLDVPGAIAGSLEDWATDCHAAGVAAYAALPVGSPARNDAAHAVPLGIPYADATLPILKRQLAVGGLRLAKLLNGALGRPAANR